MPIPVEKLDEAERPLQDRIVTFLEKSPNQAYSLLEIFAAVENYDAGSVEVFFTMVGRAGGELMTRYKEALSALVESGALRCAEYQGSQYFTVKKR